VSDDTIEINGWKIYAHSLFLDQLEAMIEKIERARKKDPKDYKKRAAKLLVAVLKVAFEEIFPTIQPGTSGWDAGAATRALPLASLTIELPGVRYQWLHCLRRSK